MARGLPRKTRDWSGMLGTGVLEDVSFFLCLPEPCAGWMLTNTDLPNPPTLKFAVRLSAQLALLIR
jgi:hypothetical protein